MAYVPSSQSSEEEDFSRQRNLNEAELKKKIQPLLKRKNSVKTTTTKPKKKIQSKAASEKMTESRLTRSRATGLSSKQKTKSFLDLDFSPQKSTDIDKVVIMD